MNDRKPSPKSPLRMLETLGDQLRIRLQYGPEFIGDLEAIPVGLTPHNCVYSEGPHRLLHYPAASGQGTPLLLVYSLINRPYIFDLRPGRSLIEYLVQQNYDVYLLDWGDPTPEMGMTTLGELVMGTLRRAVRVIQRRSRTQRLRVLGYCMGATFATLYAAYRPQDIERMVLMTPMLGYDPAGPLQKISAHQQLGPDLMTGQLIDGRRLKLFFNAVKPAGSLKKERDFWQNYDSDTFLDHFLPVEKWSNDTPNLPGKAFQELIELTVRQDALRKGRLSLDGHEIDLRQITCPVLAVATQHDWIIPASALQTAAEVLSAADYTPYLLKGGHIGLVVGRSAGALWKDLHAFFQGEAVVSPQPLP
ncbi:MAG: alpha/beta fold hydrolase [Candidatus Sericytochromatia bacterium]